MTELTPAAERIVKAMRGADQPLHVADILRQTGCSIANMMDALSLLARLELISRVEVGGYNVVDIDVVQRIDPRIRETLCRLYEARCA